MRCSLSARFLAAMAFAVTLLTAACVQAGRDNTPGQGSQWHGQKPDASVQLGPRPFYLLHNMDSAPLQEKLAACENRHAHTGAPGTGEFRKTDFSIGHRGAAMQFPEHTRESYEAAAKMGAGIIECDVTFTKDRELVCRHSQCDLHTTTNILATPLAAKCSQGFTPAVYDAEGNLVYPAQARCCTSDITLEEFKTLKGKMDAYDPGATTVEAFMQGTPDWRTDLYADNGTLMTHRESIALFKQLGVKMTPELKSASVDMPYEGDYTQQDYARQMIDEYKSMGVHPRDVFPQSFNLDDVRYWIAQESRFGQQAVYLDGRYDDPGFDYNNPATWSPSMAELVQEGVEIIAPPIWMLLAVSPQGEIVPSLYAEAAQQAGLKIITWTLERDGPLANGGGWYHQSVAEVIDNDGDTFKVLDVLAQQVGVIGVFSDWPATTSYYANCMGLK
ncbi:glycerophosphodiester phosphodiesterase family protein [Pseudomaricurvus sp. HS19]|uniref:glycerophosphodiester phosphodiesterase family protein n=1 Tax=Pseudomaricurvus sp. HS19 TaxID=2692626 RepID=UPI001368A3B5|nr:glycerophosphodiester phosphodiesterase family protein [Pseudomaricurvus sp. HS19]MYM63649.1 glycerophosphodiester phosphodiesterase [Pseudomaricurvus sp. HS19]